MTRNGNDGKNENNADQSRDCGQSHDSHGSHTSHRIIPPRADYQTLLSYQNAEVVYDITFRFTHKFLGKGDRTIDQMIQAARSGKQNILTNKPSPKPH